MKLTVEEDDLARQVAIIGAGAAGLAAAYDLHAAGPRSMSTRRGAEIGGLAAGFRDEGWEWTLEKFYHHWFANDDAVLGLIRELGAQDKLMFPRPATSLWLRRQNLPDGSPEYRRGESATAALVAGENSIRPGRAVFAPDQELDADGTCDGGGMAAALYGREAYETLWRSLLIGKFGENYDKVNMAWMWARIYKRTPHLGTFEGGFQAFLELLASHVREQGATIHLNAPVQRIEPLADGRLAVQVGDSRAEYDAVISTSSPQVMLRLVPELPKDYAATLTNLKNMGAVVVVLALKHQLLTDGTYWLSLPSSQPDKSKSEFPFLALVEHTNYMDARHYGGDHLVYCGDYVAPDHVYFSLSEDELVERFIAVLSRFNPQFSPEWIRKRWVFRTRYAQPIPFVNHSQALPAVQTPIKGLYLASMSQVYPWDRGTNYAVEMGRKVAGQAADFLTL